MNETRTSVENQRFRHSTRRLENATASKLAELIESLEAIEELNEKVLAAIEGETEAVFERVRKRLKGARMYIRDGMFLARRAAAEAAAGMETNGGEG